jgi:nucleotide-binding universal stress UspA family protein
MKMDAGDPAEEIVDEAATGDYDVVVVGSRELGALGRLVLGSVSTEVVARAPCPVLVAGADITERIEPIQRSGGERGP